MFCAMLKPLQLRTVALAMHQHDATLGRHVEGEGASRRG